ncbi:Hypothetical predicted protein [Lecanosticta acicola]|uniref:Uncharacterized protein n=1 Tax=Lecanosticta acicola TaxID=111012 RepID=A0AAI8YW09_9PEZI|nr:Hypothetical predicted protein [Lecanosticta acicola]
MADTVNDLPEIPNLPPFELDNGEVERSEPTCRLLNLPAELRNEIYELVLVSSGRIELTTTRPKSLREPAFLAISRQIRTEATAIYYGSNTFCRKVYYNDGRRWSLLEKWLRKIGPERCSMLREMVISSGWTLNIDWVKGYLSKHPQGLRACLDRGVPVTSIRWDFRYDLRTEDKEQWGQIWEETRAKFVRERI